MSKSQTYSVKLYVVKHCGITMNSEVVFLKTVNMAICTKKASCLRIVIAWVLPITIHFNSVALFWNLFILLSSCFNMHITTFPIDFQKEGEEHPPKKKGPKFKPMKVLKRLSHKGEGPKGGSKDKS